VIQDTDASHTLTVVGGSNLTANRTLTITTGDNGNKTLEITGASAVVSFQNTAFTSIGAYSVNLTFTAATSVTFPISGTLSTLAGSETLTNKTLTTPTIGSFTNATHSHQDAAGGGTLSAAAVASGTLAVARGGTGVGAIQSFSTYRGSNQTIASGGWSKVSADTERWDVGGIFDSSTNYRFTPTVAGIYLVAVQFYTNNAQTNAVYGIACYKNGGLSNGVLGDQIQINAATGYLNCQGFGLITMNGSSDYAEFFAYNGHGSLSFTLVGGVNNNRFDGIWQGPTS